MDKAKINAQLEKIRKSYIASLAEKKAGIISSWASLQNEWDEDVYKEMYIIIHGLAGSAETFGLNAITKKARKVIDQLKAQKLEKLITTHDKVDTVDKLINKLLDEINQVS